METADTIRDKIIDKLLTISDKENLMVIKELVNKTAENSSSVSLSSEQITMLQMSDADIIAGRIISQDELDKADQEWLQGK